MRIIKGTAAFAAVLAIASLMVVGSHALRSATTKVADACHIDDIGHPGSYTSVPCSSLAAPAPSAAPIDTSIPAAPCAPGEGGNCFVVATVPSPTPTDSSSAGTVAPAGQIEVGATWYIAGQGPGARIGIMVTVLSGGAYVIGASVSGSCSGPGVSLGFSGTTADRSAWQPTIDPSIPSGPSAFFWTVATADFQAAKYVCQGSANYNGLSASF